MREENGEVNRPPQQEPAAGEFSPPPWPRVRAGADGGANRFAPDQPSPDQPFAEPAASRVPTSLPEPAREAPNPAVDAGGQGADSPTGSAAASAPAASPAPHPEASSPVESSRPSTAAKETRRKGPGWFGLATAMALTAFISIGAGVALSGGPLPDEISNPLEEPSPLDLQSGLVETVEETVATPDWAAVATAVRPATISIRSDGGGETGTGSGVIVVPDGTIITNYHVVANAMDGGDLTVILNDGRLYSAYVVGTDPTTDLAVVRLENPPEGLVAVNFADSDELVVGQPVMAVGSPLGLTDTVTLGIISALERPVLVTGEQNGGGLDPYSQLPEESGTVTEAIVTNAIQTDAPINPGNSGGPLFDDSGAIVGINSSIASRDTDSSSVGSIGLGFAIPSNLVKDITEQIIATGSAQHAMLGVQIASSAVQAEGMTRLGASVEGVVPGSAAEAAGVFTGDVIISIDGRVVTSGPSLTGFVRRHHPGDAVVLEVVRNGEVIELPATLQAKE